MFRTLLPPGSSPNRAETQVCLTLMVEPIVHPPAAQQRITPSQQSVERPEGRSPPFGHDVALADYLAQPGGVGGRGAERHQTGATVRTSHRHRHLDTSPRTASLAGAPAGEGPEVHGRGIGGILRIAIDTNIVDTILDNPGFLQEIHIAGTTDALILITNHPLHDEVSATSDADKRERLLAASEALPKKKKCIPTGLSGVCLNGDRLRGERVPALESPFKTFRQKGEENRTMLV